MIGAYSNWQISLGLLLSAGLSITLIVMFILMYINTNKIVDNTNGLKIFKQV